MKRITTMCLLMVLSGYLASCAYTRSPYLRQELATETWQRDIDRHPSKWMQGADNWFLTGDPNATEIQNKHAPYSESISTMQVKVPNFTNIVTEGDFQVQIFGTLGSNSVYVYGPNADVRETMVHVKDNTLYLNQSKAAKPRAMHNVIIRIGVGALNGLRQLGAGTIEAIQLPSAHLTISSVGNGNMYLAGNMNVTRVDNSGKGTISIFGARTPTLDVTTTNEGSINVSGAVGIHSIVHHGKGNVNIIGANSDSLKINADGSGKIGISGIVNLQEVQARDNVSVLVDCVFSNSLYVYSMQRTRVGIAGNAKDLYVYASGVSTVFGRYLNAQNAYVQAKDGAHVNAGASNKIFASATTNASVYFFGEPKLMSQFVSGNGLVIPVWTGGKRQYPARMTAKYKDEVPPRMSKRATSYGYKSPYKYKWVNGKLVTYKVS